jgi:hypothetical protein
MKSGISPLGMNCHSNSSQYSTRNLNPDNLKQGSQLLKEQLQWFKEANSASTSERVQRGGFILISQEKKLFY